MRYLTIRHAGIAILLVVYFAAVFYLVPIFSLGLLEPGIGNKAIHFAITYAMATFSTYFSRLFYVSDVSFRFELAAGLMVAFVFFVLIGQPRMKLAEPRHEVVQAVAKACQDARLGSCYATNPPARPCNSISSPDRDCPSRRWQIGHPQL